MTAELQTLLPFVLVVQLSWVLNSSYCPDAMGEVSPTPLPCWWELLSQITMPL